MLSPLRVAGVGHPSDQCVHAGDAVLTPSMKLNTLTRPVIHAAAATASRAAATAACAAAR